MTDEEILKKANDYAYARCPTPNKSYSVNWCDLRAGYFDGFKDALRGKDERNSMGSSSDSARDLNNFLDEILG